ncbi:MAG: SDR family NAD(P)-dependent oxidoreductase [Alphaproteobacteria bacterium]|nr:SDR family NAD(P)-dependent oxidoreductase [Alphaproteobacteria bacterium]
MTDLRGATVLVTGASAGIGAAVARRFAREGANLVLVARGRPALDALATELRDLGGFGAPPLVIPADVGDVDACLRVIDEATQHFGRLDVVVNNAGMHLRGPFADHDARGLGQMVDVNLRGPLVLTRAALPYLQASPVGAVVQVASLAGCVPLPNSATYSSTKAGLRFLSLALAEELRGSGVRVAVVNPGPVDTGFIMDDLDSVSDLTFSQPLSTADAVAAVVVDAARGGADEVCIPALSGRLTTVTYLFPGLARALRPWLERRGRAAKARLRARG